MAETDEECLAAQRLRYRVFFDEMGATPVAAAERHQMDVVEYKDIADHVIVADTAGSDSDEYVVETYRIIRRDRAMRSGN
ncbi:MAG: GNAT family N-acyltransferase [Pseudomonadota bacterium]|nr:GNAT family N-acyltransferase [Pseudomonadota bacterium]